MRRMFPLLGSLLGSTPGRRRGGGVQGSFDFTTMSSAQLQEADWSWTRANAIYVPDSAGDYAEIASGVLAKSDLGVHCFGGFVNMVEKSDMSWTSLPATWRITSSLQSSTEETYKNLPGRALSVVADSSGWIVRILEKTEVYAGPVCVSAVVGTAESFNWALMVYPNGSGETYSGSNNPQRRVFYCPSWGDIGVWNARGYVSKNALPAVSAVGVVYLAGPQVTKTTIAPNVLALSSAATTETASQIPVLSRVTSGECSFVLPVITGPGRKGADDVIASASLDANNQLLAIHENANNNILLRLVTAGSTVGEVDLGVVGDNVYTVISGKIEYADGIGRLAGALEGMSEMVEATGSGIIPPAAFTRWTLGNDHSQAAATQFWGSVLGLRIN